MKLRAIHFMPGVTVSVGGKYTALSFWDREKYPEIACEYQQGGDALIWWKDSPALVRKIYARSISWDLYEREEKKPEIVRGSGK